MKLLYWNKIFRFCLLSLFWAGACGQAPQHKEPSGGDLEPSQRDCYQGLHLELTSDEEEVTQIQYIHGDCYGEDKVVTRYSSSEKVNYGDQPGMFLNGTSAKLKIKKDKVYLSNPHKEIGDLVFENGHYKVNLAPGMRVTLALPDGTEMREWKSEDGTTAIDEEEIWLFED